MFKHFMALATPVPSLALLLTEVQKCPPPMLSYPGRCFLGKLRPQSNFCPATAACHGLSQELAFNLNLSPRCASGHSQVWQVVTPAAALLLTQLGCQHSLADSFCFLFSPFPHHTPFTAPCYPSAAPNSRRALSRSWSCFTLACETLHRVAFQDRGHRSV